jgi:hypothetical protein
MTLSIQERRQLAAVERALSRDPVLSAVADLFPQPPVRTHRSNDSGYHRWRRPGMLLAAVLIGVTGTVTGAALVVPVLLAVGLVALVGGVLAFVGTTIHRGTHPRRAVPALAIQTREGG